MPLRLLDILHKKSIPRQIIQWVRSFLSKRQTIISISRHQLVLYQVLGRAPQESLLFLILFLFYNTKLISLCLGPRTIAIGFINNTNILAYRKSTATTYRALEEAYAYCLLQARKFEIKFTLSKYKLIYFTYQRQAFNLLAIVQLGDIV